MTLKINIETAKVVEFIKFEIGNIVMVTGGRNRGGIGVIQHCESIKAALMSYMLWMLQATSLPLGWGMCSPLDRELSPRLHFPKAKGYQAFYCGQGQEVGSLRPLLHRLVLERSI
jgi:small subunit ribosomal protein S4e